MLRIGRIEYANCTPLFRTLQEDHTCNGYQFITGVPAQLNYMLAAGMIDICPSSSIEYALHSEQYLILPKLSISSVGAVGSVLLFSRVPLQDLNGCHVLLSSESATSVNLLKIILEKRFGCRCNFSVHTSSFDEALQQSPALLLIGDAALRASLANPELYVYDLGQLWHEWTALPFVFALWLCRQQVAKDCSVEVHNLAAQLVKSKNHARKNLQTIAESSPEASWMGTDRLVTYWRENISYDLDDEHIKGLNLFYHYCAELGLLQSEPVLDFLKVHPQKDI